MVYAHAKKASQASSTGKPWIYMLSLRWRESNDENGNGPKQQELADEFQSKMHEQPWYTVINPNNHEGSLDNIEVYPEGGGWHEWYVAHLCLGIVVGQATSGYMVLIQMGPPDGPTSVKQNENLAFEKKITSELGIWISSWNENISAKHAEYHYRRWAHGMTNKHWEMREYLPNPKGFCLM